MKSFSNNQRVRVIDPESEHKALDGACGTVVRLKIANRSAWVEMDQLPEALAVFPDGDARRNHIVLWPDECEAAHV